MNDGVKPTTVNCGLDDLKSSLANAQQWGLLEKVKRNCVDERDEKVKSGRIRPARFLVPAEWLIHFKQLRQTNESRFPVFPTR